MLLLTAGSAPSRRALDEQAIDKEKLGEVEGRAAKLAAALGRLRKLGVSDASLTDTEVFHRAALQAQNLNEIVGKDSIAQALAVLDLGLLRASQEARGERPWLDQRGQSVPRGYRSRIDGSVQPYAVTYPADYGTIRGKRYRLDVVLHGRNERLNEVAFLHQNRGDKASDHDFVQLDIFGRGNNGYRWAGESDVYEALLNFTTIENSLNRVQFLDPSRVVLRGFSMGGAGTWHLGLHRPDQWCLLGPGAGFTTTRGYVPKFPDKLPNYQEDCLRIYDAVDYAENAYNVPIVAFAGEKDDQLQAAKNIEARLKPLDISMTLLVAPGVKHDFPGEWRKKAETEYSRIVARGRAEFPRQVRFVTFTMKYPTCSWVEILGLEEHYKKSKLGAERTDEGVTLKTANLRALHLNLWPGAIREPIPVIIDGKELGPIRPYQARNGDLHIYLEKRPGGWAATLPERLFTERLRKPQKVQGLQGPIDDAFMSPFLCVRGSAEPWHEETGNYARDNLNRFKAEWAKYFRGDLPVKDDLDVTADDMANRHLILFGDPHSNSLIADVLPNLPLKWTKKTLAFAGKEYDAAKHVPALIFPSPLASDRYVVLNSGHTFHVADFMGSNALLYPRLGDFAILKLAPDKKDPLAVKIINAGLFDDYWRIPTKDPR
jgi:dienelactone hydrolase